MRLQRNERAMLRWILNFRITDRISSVELYRKLKIPTLESALKKIDSDGLVTYNDLISGSTKSKPSTLLVMLKEEDHQKLGKTSSQTM